MRFFLLFPAAAILAATVLHSAGWAGVEADQSAVAGRLKIREELALAINDGHISRMDQYRILLHAKEVLAPEDLRGLEKTLDRLAVDEPSRTKRRFAAEGSVITGIPSEDSRIETISNERVTRVASTRTGEDKVGTDGPFVEEVPVPAKQGYSDETNVPNDDQMFSCDPSPFERVCGCGQCSLANLDLTTGVDSFKGPEDLGDANGNFGVRMGANAGVPIARRMGFGFQAGVNEIISDLKGQPYGDPLGQLPTAQIRYENFTTVGIFQRIPVGEGSIGWGFVYDWFFDNYYSDLRFGQWRVKMAYEMNPCNEFGIIAAMHDKGDTDSTGTVSFKPIDQGSVYWKHTWANDASLTGRFGVAESPSEFVFGFDGRVPISERLAFVGGATYIMPQAAGGNLAQQQDIWNVSVGLEFMLGGFRHGCAARFTPFIPVADNGSFALKDTTLAP